MTPFSMNKLNTKSCAFSPIHLMNTCKISGAFIAESALVNRNGCKPHFSLDKT